ncbi:WD40 repeat-like protein [Vararia minispora EC-137]|uniref:WD40 repeat-like protein n=1 Tax=Vararia minispora EC-137 TaxID=1314806 RepID=A0ACB8QWW5_9AGAM|nr:WD40 repeat-like protein [Vararia minispora EC-137]
MSFKKSALYPANPTTARGTATRLSASKEKIVYTNGKSVFIRDVSNPGLGIAYSGHVQNTTVARISPTGYYCASADVSGTVRIWDTVGEDQTLKGEYKAISGRMRVFILLNDLEWDGDSKRIIAVGDGKEKFGHAFMFDTGTSTGEIIGHSKAINAVSIRHQRPFRAATAADDNLIVFHQGAPYKYVKTISTHTKFVQDVRYSATGDHFASVGSDGKIFIYDGKEGETLSEVADAHKGSIFGLSWSPDSKSLSTSSADTTVKIWDAETKKTTMTYTLGPGVDHQQVGNVWSAPNTVVSLALSGDLNVFDTRSGDKPTKILYAGVFGSQKSVTAAAPLSSDTFLVGTADGRILAYEPSGDASYVSGKGHSNLVSSLSATAGDKVFSVGYDDRLLELDAKDFTTQSFSTNSQPKSIAAGSEDTVFIAETNSVEVVRSNQKVTEVKPKSTPTAIAASDGLVADARVTLYKWDGKALSEAGTLTNNKGAVSALAFSPDGTKLAAGDSSGKIVLYDAKSLSMITGRWSFHTARVLSVHWTADSQHLASGSLDTHVYIWSVAQPTKNIAIKNAVPGGATNVFWLRKSTVAGSGALVAAGADACVRVWEVKFYT